jgi:hypothetical protein
VPKKELATFFTRSKVLKAKNTIIKTFDLVPKFIKTFDLVTKIIKTFDLAPNDNFDQVPKFIKKNFRSSGSI